MRYKLKRSLNSKLKILSKILSICFLIYLLYFLYQKTFTIKHTNCQLGENACPPEVVAEIDRLKGQNLLFLESKTIEQKILNANPAFKNAYLELTLPARLSLSLTQADLLAQLATSTESGVLLIGENKQIIGFQKTPLKDLSTILVKNTANLSIGQDINQPEINLAINLANQLNKSFVNFQTITAQNTNTLIVLLDQGQQVFFDPNQDIDKQVISLQLIISQAQDKTFQSIDLRYSKPIIKIIDK